MLQVGGSEAAAAAAGSADSLTADQRREYISLMSILPGVDKRGRRLGDLLSLLTRPLSQLKCYALSGVVDSAGGRNQGSGATIDPDQLRSFADFVAHSRPIVRVFSLPPDRRSSSNI